MWNNQWLFHDHQWLLYQTAPCDTNCPGVSWPFIKIVAGTVVVASVQAGPRLEPVSLFLSKLLTQRCFCWTSIHLSPYFCSVSLAPCFVSVNWWQSDKSPLKSSTVLIINVHFLFSFFIHVRFYFHTFFFQIRTLIHILSYFCIFKNKLCNVLPIYSEWKLELTVLGLGSAGDSRKRRVGRSSVQKRKKRKNNILIKYSLMCHRRICACKNIVTLL